VHTTTKIWPSYATPAHRVVHNPLANTILGSGMPRIMDMLEAGIPIAISTDGSGSADSQNILAAPAWPRSTEGPIPPRENLPASRSWR